MASELDCFDPNEYSSAMDKPHTNESQVASAADLPADAEVEAGRRDVLRLASLAAVLGAGLSAGLRTEEAEAQATRGGGQVQVKFYAVDARSGKPTQVSAVPLPDDAALKIFKAGQVQVKMFLVSTDNAALTLELPSAPAVQMKVSLTPELRIPDPSVVMSQWKSG